MDPVKRQLKIILKLVLVKMMERKEIIRNLLIIFLVCILIMIPWASVIGIQDPGLLGAFHEFQHIAFFVIVTSLVLNLFYQIYRKPLTQEMKEEEIKETHRQESTQLLFKPTIGVSIIFLFFISLCVFPIISQFTDNKADFGLTIGLSGLMIFLIWGWYKTPVFIFTEDSVQIKSHLVYLFGIDRKTVIRYANITSVSPDAKIKGNMYGFDSRYQIVISMNGTIQKKYGLVWYNPNIIAKIYLRFKEKLGDKVRLE